jgi:hypothetical protein
MFERKPSPQHQTTDGCYRVTPTSLGFGNQTPTRFFVFSRSKLLLKMREFLDFVIVSCIPFFSF